ncbi:MAG: uncharacterized protein A8A55_1472 [Amphiamblys sp. WSBS2006]|nr:MAG: uncharacterized protein A8A55_1472 [Amphiamblys sp. WSBS2006]
MSGYDPEHTDEILKEENNSILVGKVKKLDLHEYALGILLKLKLHEENEVEELELGIDYPENVIEILKEENNSIWVGKVKRLGLSHYAVEILPKLRIYGENVVEEFKLDGSYKTYYITEILKTENNSIWVGKIRSLD